jgi:F0F1-type ATP synthase membrane subunit c/vacuolar-type H+-ATPase subunit K
MTDRLRSILSRDNIRDGLGVASIAVVAGLTVGAGAVLPAVARGWMGRNALNKTADALTKTLVK